LKYEASHIIQDKSIKKVISDLKTEIVNREFQNIPILKITAPLNISTKNWGILQFGLSTENVRKSLGSLKKELLIINIVFAAIALMLISIAANVLAKPVIRLSKKMDSIETYGDFNPQAHELKERRDEIGKLHKSFLWMIQRLRDADEEHKKTVEVLGRTEKMVSIGRLASGVAHEINNPLGGITLCFKNLIESEEMESSKKEELVRAVNDGLHNIKKIVEQLLDFSRATITDKVPVNVNDLINHLLVLLNYPALKSHIRIVNDLSDDIPEILMDENKMTQVFLNIILNAMHAMDEKGIITIKTRRDNGFCEVSINDTGAGIPSGIMPNIFDPFYTTKSVGVGTGLGLSVSKGIVEQHGGTIDVDSEIGVGTTFRIKLPIMT
jgi:signal transduction histidine kinase